LIDYFIGYAKICIAFIINLKGTFVINAKRRKGETFESLIRRFNRLVIKSKKILHAKAKRFHRKDANDTREKTGALARAQLRGKMNYLRRIGKVEESRFRRR